MIERYSCAKEIQSHMTYYLHLHNSGFYARRSFNTKQKAELKFKEWRELGGLRTAEIERVKKLNK